MAMTIMINSVLRIDVDGTRGVYRTICQHHGLGVHFLGFMDVLSPEQSPRPSTGSIAKVPTGLLKEWLDTGRAREVQIAPLARQLKPSESRSPAVQRSLERRLARLAPFLNSETLAEALISPRGLGPVVKQVVALGSSRATAYRMWAMLCAYGFDASSAVAAFDQCGAPGRTRPVLPGKRKAGRRTKAQELGLPEPQPQRALTESDRQIIVRLYRVHRRAETTLRKVYEKIILNGYVSSYEQTDKGLKPVIPPQGTFPNQRQVRHVIATDVDKLERILRATTKGHFDRNKRGLRGKAIDGVSGPGHTYAIDSTVADMYLRSSINRSWLIGRPIVYVIVDMWSTAVVGFYICLSAPSWATAKVSLFSTLCRPGLLADLWGFDGITSLDPAPALPFRLLCDRGEYLSQGAARTGIDLGLNSAFNPAYRPDLKGLVEVLHRIVKDEQYSSFVPGAMDARRRELELRPDLRESMMTMREYAQYLHLAFTQYNLFADRTHRLTGDMIAAGVVPSPAGLWRFGHEAGFGFLKAIPEQRLITSLLPIADVSVRRNGIFMAQLQYQAEVAEQLQWAARARNIGTFSEQMHHFPGSVSRLWWPNPVGSLETFSLAPNARTVPETLLDEWMDALVVPKLAQSDRDYAALTAKLELSARTGQIFAEAKRATQAAGELPRSAMPPVRDVRRLENLLGPADELCADEQPPLDMQAFDQRLNEEPEPDPYESCKQELLRQLNQDGGGYDQ